MLGDQPARVRGCLTAALGLAALMLLAPAAAAGSTRHASPTGTGGPADCPASNPCSLTVAVTGAVSGDEVVIAPGAYDRGTSSLSIASDITVHGALGSPPPLIFGTANVLVSVTHPDALLSDVRLRSDTSAAGSGVLLLTEGTARRIDARGAETTCALRDGLLTDSFCVNESTATTNALSMVALSGSHSARAVNVTAVARGGAAIVARALTGATASLAIHNTIAEGSGAALLAVTDSSGGAAANLTAAASNFPSSDVIGTGTTVAPAGSGSNQGAGSAPIFADSDGGDYDQAEGSPTINSGEDTAADLGPLSVHRDPRILQGLPDIGADEFDPTTTPGCISAVAARDGAETALTGAKAALAVAKQDEASAKADVSAKQAALASAEDALETARQKLKKAKAKLKKAKAKLKKAKKAGSRKAIKRAKKGVAKAKKGVRRAKKAKGRAAGEVADAEAGVDRAQQSAAAATQAAASAASAVSKAEDDLTAAQAAASAACS